MSDFLRIPVCLALLLLVAGLAAGCGGTDAARADERVERESPRTWFGPEESDVLNPALADYNLAALDYNENSTWCAERASRLHATGKPRRMVVRCQLDQTEALVSSIASLRTGIEGLEGDFRKACEDERASFVDFLQRFEDSWQVVHDQWKRYSVGGTVSGPLITRLATRAVRYGVAFSNRRIPALTAACYSPKARADAARDAVRRARAQAAEQRGAGRSAPARR